MSWCSQIQKAISTSPFESEIYSLTDAVKEVVYLRIFLEDIGHTLDQPSTIYCDNKAAVQVSTGRDTNLKRIRHLRDLKRFLDIRRRFIQAQQQDISVIHCSADRMIADLMTKPLGPKKTCQNRRQLLNEIPNGLHDRTLGL